MSASTAHIPHVIAEPAANGGVRFYCPFCLRNPGGRRLGRWHYHGGLGPKVPHCLGDGASPFLKSGYVLIPREKAK